MTEALPGVCVGGGGGTCSLVLLEKMALFPISKGTGAGEAVTVRE